MLHRYISTWFPANQYTVVFFLFQHLSYTLPQYSHTVEYFVSGAADFINPSLAHRHKVPEGSLKYYWANILSLGGFSYVEADATNMNFTFIEANGRQLYSKQMFPRKH